MNKKTARLRRATKTRVKIRQLGESRLCVFRTLKHIYAQIISPCGSQVLVSASTLDSQFKSAAQQSGNIGAAELIGKMIAERAKEKAITRVAFDRSGFRYHGRIKALADAARENGLTF